MRSSIAFAALAFLLIGCSDDGGTSADLGGSGGGGDGAAVADSGGGGGQSDGGGGGSQSDSGAASADAAPTGCGPGIYPCGTYGTKVGDTIENLSFQGYVDPQFRCKSPNEMKVDTSKLRTVTLGDFFRGQKGCNKPKKRVLWLFVSAGWCHACEVQLTQLVPTYNAAQLDPRIEVLNLLFDTKTPGQRATPDFAKTYIGHHKGQFPMVVDSKFAMQKYFPINATPLNVLVDLADMTIFYAVNGANLAAIGKAALDRINTKP